MEERTGKMGSFRKSFNFVTSISPMLKEIKNWYS